MVLLTGKDRARFHINDQYISSAEKDQRWKDSQPVVL